MTGRVTPDNEAIVPVLVRTRTGQVQPIEAVVDTGFNGYLTLSAAMIAAMALRFHSMAIAALGDGSHVALRKYEGVVVWDAQERDVLVLEADGGPLLGMAMLRGCRVAVDVVAGGSVTIEPLPSA